MRSQPCGLYGDTVRRIARNFFPADKVCAKLKIGTNRVDTDTEARRNPPFVRKKQEAWR